MQLPEGFVLLQNAVVTGMICWKLQTYLNCHFAQTLHDLKGETIHIT